MFGVAGAVAAGAGVITVGDTAGAGAIGIPVAADDEIAPIVSPGLCDGYPTRWELELAPRRVIGAAYLFSTASNRSTGFYSAGRAIMFVPVARSRFPEVDFAQSYRSVFSHAWRGRGQIS